MSLKRTILKKKWRDNRSRKYVNSKYRKQRKYYGIQTTNSQNSTVEEFRSKAPEVFSFYKNTEQTIMYFVGFIEEINKRKFKQHFYLDSRDVQEVTPDALAYILALMYNMKSNLVMRYSFKGNLPENSTARDMFINSGFLKYMQLKNAKLPQTKDMFQLKSGKDTQATVVAEVCDFVQQKLGNQCSTRVLYSTLIELMANTFSHAYNNHDDSTLQMNTNWYLYAEYLEQKVRITFVDTGEGIPRTVRRKFHENFTLNDSHLIHSALLGDNRTETGLPNRGHGLPAIYEAAKHRQLMNFFVLSGCGVCKAEYTDTEVNLIMQECSRGIYGTIYMFEMME